MEDNRKKALGAALSQIERQFGKGAVMKMGDQPREAMPPVHSGWILHWVLVACLTGGSSKFTGLKALVKPRSRCR